MSDQEDNDGWWSSDQTDYKYKRKKTKIPHFRPIVKKRVPHTEFGSIMGGLMAGMIFVFPFLALLAQAFPVGFFLIGFLIAFTVGTTTNKISNAFIFAGLFLLMVGLGFVSLGIVKLILN